MICTAQKRWLLVKDRDTQPRPIEPVEFGDSLSLCTNRHVTAAAWKTFQCARVLPGVINLQSNIRTQTLNPGTINGISRYPIFFETLQYSTYLLYWISDFQLWTLNRYHPGRYLMFSQALWCFLSRCGFTGGYISATSMTKTIECKHCDFWTIRVRLSTYILPAHTDLCWSFRCFRCCGCCAATGRTPQLISIFVPFKSGHWLVGSCGVAIVPKDINHIWTGKVWFDSHLLSNCDCARH